MHITRPHLTGNFGFFPHVYCTRQISKEAVALSNLHQITIHKMAAVAESPILSDINAALIDNGDRLQGDNGDKLIGQDDEPDDEPNDDEGYGRGENDNDAAPIPGPVEVSDDDLDTLEDDDRESDPDDEGFVDGAEDEEEDKESKVDDEVSPPVTDDSDSLEDLSDKDAEDRREFLIEQLKKGTRNRLVAKAEEEGRLSREEVEVYLDNGGGESLPVDKADKSM